VEHYDEPWASLRFYVGGRHVFFDDPDSGLRLAGKHPEQSVLPIEMEKIAQETEREACRLAERTADDVGRITLSRWVMQNAPVIQGTRIPTSAIWHFHEAGYDAEAIIREYSQLSPADVDAAIGYERERKQKRAS
jgi:uncharacterized protein (DUF433 family)